MIGIFVTARCGSSRLPNKHFLDLNGLPVLEVLLRRLQFLLSEKFQNEKIKILIVTGRESSNMQFQNFVGRGLCEVYFGSDHNIPLRHYTAAVANEYDKIVSIDGDDILISLEGLELVINELNNGCDYCATLGLPFGMNVSGYSLSHLEKSVNFDENEIIETGWAKNFGDPELLGDFGYSDLSVRATLDYPDDLEFFRNTILSLDDYVSSSTEDILSVVLDKKINMVNWHLNDKYWQNFRSESSYGSQ